MRFVAPSKWLTHFGYKGVFQGEPAYEQKSPVETSMSMTAGVQSEEHMIRMVMGRPLRKRDRVTLRYFCAWDLYRHDYWTIHDPVEANPRHVAVYCSSPEIGQTAAEARACWNQLDRARLVDLAQSKDEVSSR